ncbi:hypothetical protein DDQ50_03760 [Amnibacterium flavum]|uniref:BLUF domain-containing protein n=2 Tax=Amnibacterium flavum TaxID=2173173 RepID=A0A2V1HWP3_9MICO|nr:hypothetical protein DDQ50_03760 [Amnibacterium flavum]
MSPFHLPGSPEAPAVTPQQGLSSVIYSSRAVQDLSDDDLLELLTVSRRNNSRLGLTGVLLHRDGRFLQYLEGPEQVLRQRIDIIAADPRHTSFTILLDEEIPGRLFPAWSMGFEKLSEHAAADIPGYRDSFADLSDADAEPGTRGALDQLSRWFASRSAGAQL